MCRRVSSENVTHNVFLDVNVLIIAVTSSKLLEFSIDQAQNDFFLSPKSRKTSSLFKYSVALLQAIPVAE